MDVPQQWISEEFYHHATDVTGVVAPTAVVATAGALRADEPSVLTRAVMTKEGARVVWKVVVVTASRVVEVAAAREGSEWHRGYEPQPEVPASVSAWARRLTDLAKVDIANAKYRKLHDGRWDLSACLLLSFIDGEQIRIDSNPNSDTDEQFVALLALLRDALPLGSSLALPLGVRPSGHLADANDHS